MQPIYVHKYHSIDSYRSPVNIEFQHPLLENYVEILYNFVACSHKLCIGIATSALKITNFLRIPDLDLICVHYGISYPELVSKSQPLNGSCQSPKIMKIDTLLKTSKLII